MKMTQTQTQRLSQQQRQGIELLQMSSLELSAYVQQLALENSLVEPDDLSASDLPREDELLNKVLWLEENDRQNRFYDLADEGGQDTMPHLPADRGKIPQRDASAGRLGPGFPAITAFRLSHKKGRAPCESARAHIHTDFLGSISTHASPLRQVLQRGRTHGHRPQPEQAPLP